MFLYRWATAWALIMSNKSKIIHVALWPHYKLAFAIMYVGMYACMSWASGNFLVYASMHVTGKRIFFWKHACMHVTGKRKFFCVCMHACMSWASDGQAEIFEFSLNCLNFSEFLKFLWIFGIFSVFLNFWIFFLNFLNFLKFLKFLNFLNFFEFF